MHWLQTLEAARRRGGHAFLFTGATGDGFPPEKLRDNGAPDVLDAFENRVHEHVRTLDPQALAWVFDPVHGFVFDTSENEQAFRKLAGLPVETPPGDVIGRAGRSVAEVAPLPTDPLAAVLLIEAVMNAARAAKQPQRCVTIFPHADVLVPATAAAGGANGATLAALALLQLISDDTLRRAGHLIVLAAPTAASIHELLHRPDGPLTTIVIGKPTEDERRTFVDRCCSPDLERLRKRCDTAVEGIRKLREREQERIGHELEALQREATAHDAERERILAQDRACVEAQSACAVARVERVRSLRQEDASAEERHRTLFEEAQQLTARFGSKDPAFASEPMSAEAWLRLRPGDAVRLLMGSQRFVDLIVLDRRRGGGCVLADPAHATEPLAASGVAIEWSWKHDTLIGKTIGGIEQTFTLPEALTAVHRIPNEGHRANHRLAAINAEIATLLAERREESTRSVTAVNDRVVAATRALEREQARVLSAWEPQAERLKNRIMALTAEHAHPVTRAITELEQRLAELEQQRDAVQKRAALRPPAMGVDAFVRVTQSLGYRDVAVLLRDPDATEATVRERRIALLNRAYGHLFEVVDPPYGFEGLSGLDHVKRIVAAACQAMLRGDRKAVPQGIVFMGPPGTGKTAIAIAIAKESGLLLLKFRNFRNMFIGKTEELLEQICYALLDLAPNVCFRDETDQEDSGRDAYQGDSGVSARIRQKLMEFEADERIRGRVLFVKATNRPDLMDAAMKRDGRADERIGVFTGDAEYEGLFSVYVRREEFPCEVTDFTPFVTMVRERGFSGAAVLNLCRRAYVRGGDRITAQSLTETIERARPSADRVADARMTLAAVTAVSSTENLPGDIDRIVADAQAALRDAPRTAPYGVAAARTQGVPDTKTRS
ncbi:MAG: AAA family ATPase [bacterium]|nr:AAA family ATPase [bacterium]